MVSPSAVRRMELSACCSSDRRHFTRYVYEKTENVSADRAIVALVNLCYVNNGPVIHSLPPLATSLQVFEAVPG